MKFLKNTRWTTGLGAALILLISSGSVRAANLYWDGGSIDIVATGNGASGGTGGTWDTTIRNWDQGNALSHVSWTNANNDTAVFAGTVGTVTVASAVSVSGLVFSTANYILTNGVVTFGVDGTISNSVAATIWSSLAGGAAITKVGVGTLTLSGANSYGGGTVISAGTLSVSADNNFGATNTAITVNGNARINSTASVGPTYTRPISLSPGVTLTLQNPSSGSPTTATFSGAITGSGAITIASAGVASGSPTIALSSTNNDFTGDLTMPTTGNNDFLNFASIGDGGLITFGRSSWRDVVTYTGSANLILTNRQISLGSTFGNILDGGGNPINDFVNNGSGTVTFRNNMLVAATITSGTFYFDGSNTNDNTFAGNIPGPATSGTLSIGKWGAGKWVLSGTNTYSGTTIVSAGKLVGAVGGSCSNSAVTVSAGTFGVSVTDNTLNWACKGLTHTAASTLEFAFGANTPSTNLAPLQVNGNVAFNTTPTVSCTGSSLPAGTYPLITWTGTFSGVVPPSVTLTSGTGILVLDNANKTLWLNISATGSSKQPLTWKGPAGSEWIANEAVFTKWQDGTAALTNYQETTVGGITVGDSVLFTNTPGGVVALNTNVFPASMSVIGTNNYTISGSGSIGGAGSLSKTSTGSLTLSTTNSYSGGTSLGAGTLIIATNDALGTGSLVLSGGIIRSSDATARTLNNAVVLNGNSTVGGTGDLSFTVTGAGAVNANSTVTVSNNVTATFATAFGGAFGITKAGPGKMILTGTNNYGGGTTVSAGSLVVNGGLITNINGAVNVTGGNSTMIITNGGQVFSGGALAQIGNNNNNNLVLVVGGGATPSVWDLGGAFLNLGGNSFSASPSNNVLRVDGSGVYGGAVVTNVNGAFSTGGGGNYSAAYSSIVLTNGGQFYNKGSTYIGNPYYAVGYKDSITIVGGAADSIYSGSSSAFVVGDGVRGGARDNQILVGAGGVLTNVGFNAGDRNIDFVLGYAHYGVAQPDVYGNQLVVDGGKVFTLGNITVGYNAGGSFVSARSNAVLIANGGLVSAPGSFNIGVNASTAASVGFNSLTITNGGQLFTGGGTNYIGQSNGSLYTNYNNTAWIGGSNALWDFGGKNLFVGSASGTGRSTGNILTVSVGGVVTNLATLVVGWGTSSNNLVVLDGGSIYATSLFVTNAGIISGTGTVVAAVNVSSNSTLSPGASIGTLTLGSLTLAGTYQVELDAGSAGDKVVVTNTVNVSGATLSVTNLGVVGGSYTIIDNVGGSSVTGTFTGWAEGATNSVYGVDYAITYIGGDGNDVVLSVSGVGAAPVASFSATPTNGTALLQVVFTDSSINTPTGWAWDFDNNGSVDSTDRNPTNIYLSAGTYSVKLVATNAFGSSTNIQLNYITVNAPPATGYDLYAAGITNGLTGIQDDGDGDGYANLLEYVTGGDANNADTVARMNGTRVGSLLALQFTRTSNSVDTTIIVEGSNASTNDANWIGIATNIGGSWGSATNIVETNGPSIFNVTAYDTSPSTNRFLRLRVTRP